MPLLYYWRRDNYQRDLDLGAGYHLNQDNPVMHEVGIGDSLWAFTRTSDGRYALAAELVVQAKTMNRPNFRYGDYRVWGDVNRSRYFRVEGAPSVEQVIRSLSIRTEARVLGRSFQGHAAVREITDKDHRVLREAARDLPLEPRARILPEEKLEAALIMGDRSSVERLVRDEDQGLPKGNRVRALPPSAHSLSIGSSPAAVRPTRSASCDPFSRTVASMPTQPGRPSRSAPGALRSSAR